MNYIGMIRATREIVGMQGVGPTTSVGAQGVEAVLATVVKDAYLDIQNLREEFDFLNAKKSFLTEVAKDEYTPEEIFLPDAVNLNKYDLSSFRLTSPSGKKTVLTYKDREVLESRYINSTDRNEPGVFSIDFSDNSVILKPIPNGTYTVSFRYWEQPEILTEDVQVPKLPTQFHLLIVYKAVEKMAIYMNIQGAYGEYSYEAKMMTNQLMRKSLRKKTLRARALA